MLAVIRFGTPQVFTYIAMVTAPIVMLGMNHQFLLARAATKPAIKPVGHVNFMPPATRTGLAIIGFVGNNYLIAHVEKYKHGLNRD